MAPFRRRYSGIVVPNLREKLSYNPRTTPHDKQTLEQRAELTYKQAIEQLIPQFNKGNKPFTMEHGDAPVPGGIIDRMYIEGDSLAMDFTVTEEDVADCIDGGIVGVSMTHEFDENRPTELIAKEVSLVHIPQRPGSYITHAHGDESNAMTDNNSQERATSVVTIAASGTSGTVRTTLPTKAKMSVVAEEKDVEMKEEKKKEKTKKKNKELEEGEIDQEEEEKEKTPFRARRANESEAEYLIKKIADSGGAVPGYLAKEVYGTLSAQEVRLAAVEAERDAARKETEEGRRKQLESKARLNDLIIPVLQRVVAQTGGRLKESDRVAIMASGTTLGWDLTPPQSDATMSSSSSSSSPPPPETVESMMDSTIHNLGNSMREAAGAGAPQRGQQQQQPDQSAALLQMKEQMDRLTTLVSSLAAPKQEERVKIKGKKKVAPVKPQEEDEDEDEEEEEEEDENEEYVRGIKSGLREPKRVSVAASGTTTKRVGKKAVEKSKKEALKSMKQARQKKAAPPPPVQEEKEEEEDDEEEEEAEDEDEEDGAVDIDDSVWGMIDRKQVHGEPVSDFMNERLIKELAHTQRFNSKRNKAPPTEVIIPKKAYTKYVEQRKKELPNSRVQVAMSGTAIPPGLVRTSVRDGLPYKSLNTEFLMKKLSVDQTTLFDQTICLNGDRTPNTMNGLDWRPYPIAKGPGGYARQYTTMNSIEDDAMKGGRPSLRGPRVRIA